MSIALRSLTLGVLLMLAAPSFLCLPSGEGGEDWDSEVSDCQPEIPPQTNPNASMVALQMHQWIWIENLTSPDWAPRTESGSMYYEFLRPGFVVQQRLRLLTLRPFLYINVSYVTNGDSLCAAVLTVHRNKTSESEITDRVSCSRICYGNFTSLGTRAQLPLLVYDDWTKLSHESEFMTFDAVDPESRASYTCMGPYSYSPMSGVPELMSRQVNCSSGDLCLFTYDPSSNVAAAGCRNHFRLSWCVSDLDFCSSIEGDCPVCCRGNFCNLAVAQKAYERWLAGSSTIAPTSAPRGASHTASSLRMLGVSIMSLIIFLQY